MKDTSSRAVKHSSQKLDSSGASPNGLSEATRRWPSRARAAPDRAAAARNPDRRTAARGEPIQRAAQNDEYEARLRVRVRPRERDSRGHQRGSPAPSAPLCDELSSSEGFACSVPQRRMNSGAASSRVTACGAARGSRNRRARVCADKFRSEQLRCELGRVAPAADALAHGIGPFDALHQRGRAIPVVAAIRPARGRPGL